MFIDFMFNAYIHAPFGNFSCFFSVLIKVEILDGLSDHFRIKSTVKVKKSMYGRQIKYVPFKNQ